MAVHKPPCLKPGARIGVVAPAGCVAPDALRRGIEAIAAEGVAAVGLMATSGTRRSDLYAGALQRRGIEIIEPDDAQQVQVNAAIHAVKGGTAGAAETRVIAAIADNLAARGAERVIAGCTELVLALGSAATEVSIVDPARVLARRVVKIAG